MTRRLIFTVLLTAAVACASAAPALALTRAQIADKAEGQASFQCFVHDCKSRKVLDVAGPHAGLTIFRYRYYGMHNVHAHSFYRRCDQLIIVSTHGTVSQHRFFNCV